MAVYLSPSGSAHSSEQSRSGILLANLGTPDAPTAGALRRYLREFFDDPRVFEFPRLIWYALTRGIILNVRPRKSAMKYSTIWTAEGSPLLVISRRQQHALHAVLRERLGVEIPVALGMRYGHPSIESALDELQRANVRRLLVMPLYPQYSASTVGSTFDAVADVLKRYRWLPELRMLTDYHDSPTYIQALTDAIRSHWSEFGQPDRLLLSFHGLPLRYVKAGDPYHDACMTTARLVFHHLNLPADRTAVSFQSRFGTEPWLEPYTDVTLAEWGRAGIRHVQVMCPGFAADCLETLEEIGHENRAIFLEAGGQAFEYIPALNDRPTHIEMLAKLALRHMAGWPELQRAQAD